MQIQLEVPTLPTRLILESTLSDEEFECLAMTNDFMQLERSKQGEDHLERTRSRICRRR